MGVQKNVSKKVLVTDTFHLKSKWDIVCEYLKTKIFLRDTIILPQIHWTSNIFGPSATTIGEFWVSLIYPILNIEKTVCPKNFRMRHWWLTDEKYLALFSAGVIIKFSPSRISDMLRTGFEPLESLILGFVEWSFLVMITTTPQCHKYSWTRIAGTFKSIL